MNISKNQSGYLRIHIYEDVVCQKNEQNSTGYLVLINFINFTFSIFQSLLLILSLKKWKIIPLHACGFYFYIWRVKVVLSVSRLS